MGTGMFRWVKVSGAKAGPGGYYKLVKEGEEKPLAFIWKSAIDSEYYTIDIDTSTLNKKGDAMWRLDGGKTLADSKRMVEEYFWRKKV